MASRNDDLTLFDLREVAQPRGWATDNIVNAAADIIVQNVPDSSSRRLFLMSSLTSVYFTHHEQRQDPAIMLLPQAQRPNDAKRPRPDLADRHGRPLQAIARKVITSKPNIIFLPLNIDQVHWVAIVAFEATVIWLDPKYDPHTHNRLLQWHSGSIATVLSGRKANPLSVCCPRQDDSFRCAFFVLQYLDIVMNKGPMCFIERDIIVR